MCANPLSVDADLLCSVACVADTLHHACARLHSRCVCAVGASCRQRAAEAAPVALARHGRIWRRGRIERRAVALVLSGHLGRAQGQGGVEQRAASRGRKGDREQRAGWVAILDSTGSV